MRLQIACVLISLSCLGCASQQSQVSSPAWTPPANPDVSKINREVDDDRRAKRYEIALAKTIWFHEHALEYQQSMSGVRLSYALSSWMILAEQYPPAMAALTAARDRAEKNVRENIKVVDSFGDAAAINRELDETPRTVALFKWLNETRSKDVRYAFVYAYGPLIESREFALCAKYMNADEMLSRAQSLYQILARKHPNAKVDQGMEKISAENYRHSVANLVAVLKITGKEDDAKRIATEAKATLNDPETMAMLTAALAGTLPESLDRRRREQAKFWRAERLKQGY